MRAERDPGTKDETRRSAARLVGRDTMFQNSPQPFELGPGPDLRQMTGDDGAAADTRRPVVPGQLAVRWERHDDMAIVWLDGELDQATVTLLERELDRPPIGVMGLVVDLTGLWFIDSSGLDALVAIHWRASRRGDRLSFRHGPHLAQQPVELTRSARPRARGPAGTADVSEEDFYCALAMACVDVDHSWSGDRPGDACDRLLDPAAGASDAPSLPQGVARAAPSPYPLTPGAAAGGCSSGDSSTEGRQARRSGPGLTHASL